MRIKIKKELDLGIGQVVQPNDSIDIMMRQYAVKQTIYKTEHNANVSVRK